MRARREPERPRTRDPPLAPTCTTTAAAAAVVVLVKGGLVIDQQLGAHARHKGRGERAQLAGHLAAAAQRPCRVRVLDAELRGHGARGTDRRRVDAVQERPDPRPRAPRLLLLLLSPVLEDPA